MSRQRRTEDFGIEFKDGLIDGWVFGVPEAFRDQLDIMLVSRVDKEKTRELRAKFLSAGSDSNPAIVHREVWTRGVPPIRRFDVGHIFYSPPEARAGRWSDALEVLNAAIQIQEAKPDDEFGENGWVRFELVIYVQGKVSGKEMHTTSQAEFEAILRTGSLPMGQELMPPSDRVDTFVGRLHHV